MDFGLMTILGKCLLLSQFGLVDHIWQALIVANIGKILLLEV
jgi:hypothetical protein